MLSQLSHQLHQYLEKRVKTKGAFTSWGQEQMFIMDIMHLAEKISLTYLDKYDICPLPKSN